jgi:hypothetical protein
MRKPSERVPLAIWEHFIPSKLIIKIKMKKIQWIKSLCLPLLLWLSGTAPVMAQGREVPNTGNWLIYFGNQNFGNNKWVWHNEVQYRNYNLVGQKEQLLLRTGIGRYLSENNNILSAGYAYISTNPLRFEGEMAFLDEDNGFDEHRLWQQFITRQRFGRFYLLHRYRYEQRFFDNGDFRTRFRYFLSFNVALNKPEIGPGTLLFSAYNEVFVNGERSDTRSVFDRNRLYAALGYQFSPFVRVEVGAMRQAINTELGSRTQLQVVVFNNIPFPRKKSAPADTP